MYIAGKQEAAAAEKIITSLTYFRYGTGQEVKAAENEWSQLVGSKDTVVVTSGTAALQIALKALGIGPGDSVLVPTYTYVATPLAVTTVGAIPIYVDIDEQLLMDPKDLKRKIRKHTKAVIPVHMAGMPCNMKAILKVAKEAGIAVIEDCCQCDGGSYKGKRVGSLGDMGAFSFNEYKIISSGEGGACAINKKKYVQRARSASDGGLYAWNEGKKLADKAFCSSHYRFNNINAAILRQQIKRLDGILKSLRNARKQLIKEIKLPKECHFVESHDEEGNCGVCFLVQAPTLKKAKKLDAIFNDVLGSYRPINSSRHIYKDWIVVNEKRGGHHPDWDCFKHPKNKKIKTNYNKPLKQSDDYLNRTVLVRVPYGKSKAAVSQLAKTLNKALESYK